MSSPPVKFATVQLAERTSRNQHSGVSTGEPAPRGTIPHQIATSRTPCGKATGRNEFTCNAVLPRLHQAGRAQTCRTANRKVFPNSGLRDSPIILCPFAFPVCGDLFESWMSFHLSLSSTLGYERGISAVPRDRRCRFRGTRRHKLEVIKDLHQLKKLSQGPVRRPAGMNSPATPSAGFGMREIQTGLLKPEGATKQCLTKVPIIRGPFAFTTVRRSVRVRASFDLPLACLT